MTMPAFSRAPIARLAVARLAAAAVLAVLAGCGPLVETRFEPPVTQVPPHWQQQDPGQQQPSTALPPSSAWWESFGEADLDRLIRQALERNNDLAAAAIRVRRAQLQAGLAERAMLPSLSAELGRTDQRPLRGEPKKTSRRWSAATGLGVEADLWGRLGRQLDAARWEASATEADREATALSLAGTVANLYWQSVYLTQRMALTRESIGYTQRVLDLVRVQRDSGAASGLEMLEAQQSVEAQEAADLALGQQLVETRNALAILFDGPPRAAGDGVGISRQTLPSADALVPVAAGLPVDVLLRRPDLRAAEHRLHGSLAQIDATRASFLPTLTLTGAVDTASIDLMHILMNPIGSLGAGLALPFLNWNEMRLSVKVSQADYEEAVALYRQTLYTALAEVENALSARRSLGEQGDRLSRALDAATAAERLYETRYREGAVSARDWLDAQERRRNAQESLLENRFDRLLAQVTLYLALGGDSRP